LTLGQSCAATGTFQINNPANNITGTVSTASAIGSLHLRDDPGFTVGSITAANGVTLLSDGAVNGTNSAIATTCLTVGPGSAPTGSFTLTGAGNAVTGNFTTLSAVGAVAFRNDAGITETGLNATSSVTLLSDGLVNGVGGAVTASNLVLGPGGASTGAFTMTNAGNAISGAISTSGTVGSISFVDLSGFRETGLAAAGNVALTTSGAVDGTAGAIRAGSLTVNGGASSVFTLTAAGNAISGPVMVPSAKTFALRDDPGMQLGPLNVSGTLTLLSDGLVDGSSSPLTPANLVVGQGSAPTGVFRLTNGGNHAGTISTASPVGTLVYRDDSGINETGLKGGTISLQTCGAVNGSSGAIVAGGLELLSGCGPGASYTLTNTGNAIRTLAAASVADLTVVNTGALAIGAVNGTRGVVTNPAGGTVSISTAGALSLAESIDVGGRTLDLTSAGAMTMVAGHTISAFTLSLNAGPSGQIGTPCARVNTQVNNLTITSGPLAGASGAFLNQCGGLMVNAARVGGTFDLIASGPITGLGATSISATTATLNAGFNDIGASAAPLGVSAATLNITGATNAFVSTTGAQTVNAQVGNALTASVGGDAVLGAITAGSLVFRGGGALRMTGVRTGTFDICTVGSIQNGCGATTALTSTGSGRLQVTGPGSVIGSLNGTDPFSCAVSIAVGGQLTINVAGTQGGTSAVLFGTLPSVTDLIVQRAPGQVFFNGFPVNSSDILQNVTTALGQGAASAAFSAGSATSDLISGTDTADDDVDAPRRTPATTKRADDDSLLRKKKAPARPATAKLTPKKSVELGSNF